MRKEKLSIPSQISHMKKKGILFEEMSDAEAKRFLENNTYYFKIKAYRKNFDKYISGEKTGQYINLDFAYLRDLSTIDAHLRKIILRMCIDIEHFLKVKMLTDLNKTDEDGYEIIEELFQRYPAIKEDIVKKKDGSTCASLIDKYSDSFAIWNIVEVLSFRQSEQLYQLYCERQSLDLKLCNAMFSVRKLRNAAAHNNCLINELKSTDSKVKYNNDAVMSLRDRIPDLKEKSIDRWMTQPVIHDFVVMLQVYSTIVPEPARSIAFTDLKNLFQDRLPRHADYYKKNEVLCSAYKFTKKNS